jgi:ATP-dependent DNA ligase
MDQAAFGQGRSPGGPSRWSQNKDLSWEAVRPELVCEVAFDHMQGDRFRHGTTFVRWRRDKPPSQCTYDQLAEVKPLNLETMKKLL